MNAAFMCRSFTWKSFHFFSRGGASVIVFRVGVRVELVVAHPGDGI